MKSFSTHQYLNISLILLSLSFFGGCAQYNYKVCESLSWDKRGYWAALNGDLLSEEIQHFNNTCGKDHGIYPKVSTFKKGHQRGLKIFCQRDYAYQFGLRKLEYKNTCPKNMEDEFFQAYYQGLEQSSNNKNSCE